jgi:N-acetylmuramoyl-L-alanine amidase
MEPLQYTEYISTQEEEEVTQEEYETPEVKEEIVEEEPAEHPDRHLLAQIIDAEAKGEPFEGKVAVGVVVLNRVESSEFPNTVRDVIYEPGQFQPVSNGAINNNPSERSYKAADAALNAERTESLFFYNPAIATSRWLDERETTKVIGNHTFKK